MRRCCAAASAPPASSPTTGRRSESGHRCRPCRRARSPHRPAAAESARARAAPAAPTEALVDASTIERCCVCDESSCASSSSTAVPDRSATAPTWVESRWATITIEPGVRPASVPVTVSISRGPSTVCALNDAALDLEPVLPERLLNVVGDAGVGLGARSAARVLRREVLHRGVRSAAVERVRR